MKTEQPTAIKTFISYSWSSPTHETWVLDLATRLRNDGVDVKLDKWELAPGRDPIVFMEQMVTDPTVTKVLMITDRIYTEKANGRLGGVGKEAQILTAEIYEKVGEDKYAALVTEVDNNGKPYVPTYYNSRQYIDFTDVNRQEEKYQELLRWIYDKPQHKKPKLGSTPSFISEPDAVTTATTSKVKQAEHLIKSSNLAAGGAIADFGEALIDEFSSLRVARSDDEPWDESVIKMAESMRPALRNLGELILAEARFGGGNLGRILRIFERMGSFMYRAPDVRSYSEDDFDAYRMMCYEGFLSLTSILIMESRWDMLQIALEHPYLIVGRDRSGGSATTTYRVFCPEIASFRRRNDRLGSNRIDMYADLIAETYPLSFPTFEQMFQADLVLFLRGQIVSDNGSYENWWPRTLIYSGRVGLPELFARSESKSFFESWSLYAFGPITLEAFNAKVAELQEGTRRSWGGGFSGPSLVHLTNSQYIGSRA